MASTKDTLNGFTETSTTAAEEPTGETIRPLAPGLVIIAHPDRRRVGEEAPLAGLSAGKSHPLSRREPRFLSPSAGARPRPLESPQLSRSPLLLSPGTNPGEVVLERNGSPIEVRIQGESVDDRQTLTTDEVERGVILALTGGIALLLLPLPVVPMSATPSFGLVGHSFAMAKLRREIQAAALLDVPVLIRGETGSGKELVARGVHDARARGGPYLAVNFGALVPALAASELFGATRGAYTGADRQREGLFGQADGGTLFLDEIGEAPVEVQVMLLRTLETGRVQAVGGAGEKPVDVHVIAATDADLEAAIDEGKFRPALLHRLTGYEIRVPPLRERRDDIARLLLHFLRQESSTLGTSPADQALDTPWPSARVLAALVSYDWPGNVRELKNIARRLAVLRHIEGPVSPEPLLAKLLHSPRGPSDQGSESEASSFPTEPTRAENPRHRRGGDVDSDEMLEVLEQHHWKPGPAAKALGISRASLYRLIEAHPDLRVASEIPREEILAAVAQQGSVSLAARALKVSATGFRRRMRALGIDSEET